jgi:hypothetical protein
LNGRQPVRDLVQKAAEAIAEVGLALDPDGNLAKYMDVESMAYLAGQVRALTAVISSFQDGLDRLE